MQSAGDFRRMGLPSAAQPVFHVKHRVKHRVKQPVRTSTRRRYSDHLVLGPQLRGGTSAGNPVAEALRALANLGLDESGP